MPWITYDKATAPRTDRPYVTVQKRGLMSLNAAAYEQLGKPEAVELLYDPDNKRIAFKPAPDNSPRAHLVRRQNENRAGGGAGTYLVPGRAFASSFGIDTSTARRYIAYLEDDLLVVDLTGDSADASGARGRAKGRG